MPPGDTERTVEAVIRTLLANGYAVTGVERSPRYIELACERSDHLGARCRFLIAATDEGRLTPAEIETVEYSARRDGRAVVFVGREATDAQLAWEDFFDALGGGVPAWRALADFYGEWLAEAARNRLPESQTGEAWRLFEELIADGLGFVFGRRVVRLGAMKRGQAVSDLVAQIPTSELVVVDGKASGDGFNVTKDSLRALVEYTTRQRDRQQGQSQVVAALVLSSEFAQDEPALSELARWFLGEARVPLGFMDAALLGDLVSRVKVQPQLRMALRWRQILTGGRVTERTVDTELKAADEERYPGKGQ
jgi:hypothetical protein